MKEIETLVGKRLGRYEVVEYLGRGAMSNVFKGLHSGLERYVAIKILHPEFSDDEEFVAMFQREARNLANLAHPNIVQVYDFVASKKGSYIVMEYIHGPTLKNLIDELREEEDRMSIRDAVKVVKNIANALSHAHRRNIIHRDVKPSA